MGRGFAENCIQRSLTCQALFPALLEKHHSGKLPREGFEEAAPDGFGRVFRQNEVATGGAKRVGEGGIAKKDFKAFVELREVAEPQASVRALRLFAQHDAVRMDEYGTARQPAFEEDDAQAFIHGRMAEGHRASHEVMALPRVGDVA